MKARLAFALFVLSTVPALAQEVRVYEVTDAQGVPSFSDVAQPGAEVRTLEIEDVPADRIRAAQSRLAETQAMADELAEARLARAANRRDREIAAFSPAEADGSNAGARRYDDDRYYSPYFWLPPPSTPVTDTVEEPPELPERKPFEPAFRPTR